jgi:hypothetical protein
VSTHSRYDRSLGRRYHTSAGFFNLPYRMAVSLSFSRHWEKKRGGFISSRTAMEKMSEHKHSSNIAEK